MTRLDRYVLVQLIGPFFFFCMVFAGILWLNQALAIIDIVIDNGQPASIFVELSVLLLPKVLESAIPIAGFAASIFVTNRLFGESELVVMMTAGISNLKLTKPFFVFGFLCLILMFILVQFVNPWTKALQLDKRDEIRRQFITQIIQPGEFITNQGKFTFFFGAKQPNGAVSDVMIEERVNETVTVTHIAKNGQVVNKDGAVTLVLFNGSIQRLDSNTKNISLVQFETLAFDLTQMGGQIPQRKISNDELNLFELRQSMNALAPATKGYIEANTLFHERIAVVLLVLLSPALGMTTLLVGGFSRSGFLVRIAVGVLLMASVNSLRGAAESWASGGQWIMVYSPVFLTILFIAILIWLGNIDIKNRLRSLRNSKAIA